MTTTEKIDILSKIDTMLDGIESYITKLKTAEEEAKDTWNVEELECAEIRLQQLRRRLNLYNEFKD